MSRIDVTELESSEVWPRAHRLIPTQVASGEVTMAARRVKPPGKRAMQHMKALGLVAQPTSVALIIEHVGPGSVFGEGSTLGCSRRIDEAISRGQTELLTIPGDDFRQTLNLVPKLRWRVLNRAAKRAKFPTSKTPLSAGFHSFRLIFGRAIISRNGLGR